MALIWLDGAWLDRETAKVSKAWPYEEARKLLKRYPDGPGARGIVFETGYGPSGLPHLGTFQEVARTLMVRHALGEMVEMAKERGGHDNITGVLVNVLEVTTGEALSSVVAVLCASAASSAMVRPTVWLSGMSIWNVRAPEARAARARPGGDAANASAALRSSSACFFASLAAISSGDLLNSDIMWSP